MTPPLLTLSIVRVRPLSQQAFALTTLVSLVKQQILSCYSLRTVGLIALVNAERSRDLRHLAWSLELHI